jgi:hypothetical protein
MTAVAPEPDHTDLHLPDSEQQQQQQQIDNASPSRHFPPPFTVFSSPTTLPSQPKPGGGGGGGNRSRGVSRFAPVVVESPPYSYEELLVGKRDPNIPGPNATSIAIVLPPRDHSDKNLVAAPAPVPLIMTTVGPGAIASCRLRHGSIQTCPPTGSPPGV